MEQNIAPQQSVHVYYDGLCHLCSREISHYRGMRGAENIRFIDITGADFDSKREGLDAREIHKSLHVRARDGKMKVGVDGFIAIWSELPALRPLAKLASISPVRAGLSLMYAGFAKVRPLLPRKSCEQSPYCDTRAI